MGKYGRRFWYGNIIDKFECETNEYGRRKERMPVKLLYFTFIKC